LIDWRHPFLTRSVINSFSIPFSYQPTCHASGSNTMTKVYDKGMLSATLSIIKDDGPTVLLGGLGSTVVGYGIEGAMKFGVYEVFKPIMTKLIKGSKGAAYIAASVFAGAVASILLCPMESTRIRQVTDPKYADKGLMTAFPQLVEEEGFGPMFSGIWAMLSKQVGVFCSLCLNGFFSIFFIAN
jgi:hypothetical protein